MLIAPLVCRFHWKRALTRTHHQPSSGFELGELIGVLEPPTEKARHERHSGANADRARRNPGNTFNVPIPLRCVVRVGGELGHDLAWSADERLYNDIDH